VQLDRLIDRFDRARRAPWPIRWTVFVLVVSTVGLLLVGQLLLAYGFYGHSITAEEDTKALERTRVLVQSFDLAQARLRRTTEDYAPWQKSFDFLAGRLDARAFREQLPGTRLERLMLDGEAFVGGDGRVRIGHLKTQPRFSEPVEPERIDALLDEAGRSRVLSAERVTSGFVRWEGRVWLWSAAPVVDGSGLGPSPGWWLTFRDLELVLNATTNQLLGGERRLLWVPQAEAGTLGVPTIVGRSDDRLVTRAAIGPVGRGTILVLEARADRSAFRAFLRTRWFFTISSLVVALVVAAAMLLVLDRKLLRPLQTLAGQLGRVAAREPGGTTFVLRRPAPEIERVASAVTTTLDALQAQRDAERARDAALEADRLKSEFMAAVTHEIRTPMHGVLGMAELLTESPLPPRERERVRALHGAVVALQTIVDDVLTLSTIEAGRMRLQPAPTHLPRLIEDMRLLYDPPATRQGLAIRTDVDAGLHGTWLVDEARLRQVLGNLIGNAVKFTRSGSVTITLRALPGAPPGRQRLEFEVRDTGSGISPEQQAGIFEAFVQGPELRGGVTGGVGLGLAIVRQLVALMGGRISLESEPGRGAAFRFALDLEAVADTVEMSSPTPKQAAMRVLVVDDNASGRAATVALLEHLGAEIVEANSGEEALRRCADAADDIDLVLMDVRMPGLDGYETTRRLRAAERAHGRARRLTVVALSANSSPEDRAEGLACGMDGYLTKPVRLKDLRRALQSLRPTNGAAVA
jgi:signal transduction histidine kinase/ActR/RegA family two-component response regulator